MAGAVGARAWAGGASAWSGGVAFLGASVPRARRTGGNTKQTSEVRASERCARELARGALTDDSGGEGPGAVDAVYCAPVGGPKGK